MVRMHTSHLCGPGSNLARCHRWNDFVGSDKCIEMVNCSVSTVKGELMISCHVGQFTFHSDFVVCSCLVLKVSLGSLVFLLPQ